MGTYRKDTVNGYEIPNPEDIKVGNEYEYGELEAYKSEYKVELMIVDAKGNQLQFGKVRIENIYKSCVFNGIYYDIVIVIKEI